MREIKLSNSDRVTLVSDCDYEYVSRYKWFVKSSQTCDYIATSARQGKKVKTIRLHRLVAARAELLLPFNTDDEVHHINADTYDNRRENLAALPQDIHVEMTWEKRKAERCDYQ
jgi:hypothetical protein